MGGTNNSTNIVKLTPEEHYVAHQLLLKIYPNNNKLVFAAFMMTIGRNNNKAYGWLKKKQAKTMSKAQSGIYNSQYGTIYISNIEKKLCKKVKKENLTTFIKQGWIVKRVINWDIVHLCIVCKKNYIFTIKDTCGEDCRKIQHKLKIVSLLNPLYERYKNGETLQSVAKDYEYSYVSLYIKFKKYFPLVIRTTGRGNKKKTSQALR